MAHQSHLGAAGPPVGSHAHLGGDALGHAGVAAGPVASEWAVDPVCGMHVAPATAAHRSEHHGQAFYFCSAGCKTKFDAGPDRYLSPVSARTVALEPGTIYTCPMHPQIRQAGPGACPICGMALEPETVSRDARPNAEFADMSRRFWFGLVLTVPLVALAMGEHLLGDLVPMHVSAWVQLALATPVVLWAGWPFFERGWKSLGSRNLNMFTLIAAGTGIAFLYSLVATAFPQVVPAGGGMEPPLYYEAAAVIIVLALLGQVLELSARARTSGALRALLDLAPATAHRLRLDGGEAEVSLAEVVVGDRLRVRPGDRVPLDGFVVEGSSLVDESMVTGEPVPVRKEAGAAVVGGTINGQGMLVMETSRIGNDTVLARITQLVSQAQRSRAPIQSLVDEVSAWFVPLVLVAAVLAFGAWLAVGPEPRFPHALLAAVSVLIIACPCALGLATPMSVMVGLGRGAEAGILIRNAEALQALARADTLVVDKTGTLTEGRPAVTAILPAPGFDETEILVAAASIEQASEHPLGRAVVEAAQSRGLAIPKVEGFDSVSGKGVLGTVRGRRAALGNTSFLRDAGVDAGSMAAAADAQREQGATVVFLALDGLLAGAVAIADPLRPAAVEALASLKAEGFAIVMLTGDNAVTAASVGRRTGIEDVRADMLPAGKAEVVAALKRAGRVVAMVGDGVNDAPALALADIGIAVGSGTDVAIESAGVTLLGSDLMGLVRARHLSRATMRNIRQNLFFAFAYNAAGVPIAAGVLYPLFGLQLSPMIAALAMALSSVSVVGNALRLRRSAL